MRPTSIQGNASHNTAASEAVDVLEKKVLIQFVLAVECRVAERMSHVALTANTATMAIMCSDT